MDNSKYITVKQMYQLKNNMRPMDRVIISRNNLQKIWRESEFLSSIIDIRQLLLCE